MGSTLWADYIIDNDMIAQNTPTVNFETFSADLNRIGNELETKTGWRIYLTLKNTLNGEPMIEYQKSVAKSLKAPFVLLSLAHREQKYNIYGSKGYRDVFDIESVKRSYIEPVLGSKVKGDPRQKYLSAMYNGYAEIAEEIAASKGIELESAVGNTNRLLIMLLSVALYGFLVITAVLFFYKKILKKRQD